MAEENTVEFDSKLAAKFFDDIFDNTQDVSEVRAAYAGGLSGFVFRDVVEHFEQQMGPDKKWQEWSDIYSEHMSAIGKSGNNILQDTGRLRQSFTPENYRAGNGEIMWFNPAKTKEGFPYAKAHDEGGPKLPQRSFMWLSKEALDKITDFTLQFIMGKGRK